VKKAGKKSFIYTYIIATPMKIKPECVPCLLNRVLYETNLVAPERGIEVMARCCNVLSNELKKPDRVSSEVATKVHGEAYRIIGNQDPYRELKRAANASAVEMIPEIEEKLKNCKDALSFLMLAAIAGNTLDFGIRGALSEVTTLKTKFWDMIAEGFGVDDTKKIISYIPNGNILYFTDNCGEIVFDKLLIQELRKLHPERITLVVKGKPILSDATLEDALELKMDEVVDDIITTNGFAVGLNFRDMGAALTSKLKDATFVISKGMANYEALSETSIKPIAYLLKAKCRPVAESIGAKAGDNVARIVE